MASPKHRIRGLIRSSLVSYTLADHVENLTLTSYSHVDGTGNLLDNVIVGNSGHNKLVGSVNDYAAVEVTPSKAELATIRIRSSGAMTWSLKRRTRYR